MNVHHLPLHSFELFVAFSIGGERCLHGDRERRLLDQLVILILAGRRDALIEFLECSGGRAVEGTNPSEDIVLECVGLDDCRLDFGECFGSHGLYVAMECGVGKKIADEVVVKSRRELVTRVESG